MSLSNLAFIAALICFLFAAAVQWAVIASSVAPMSAVIIGLILLGIGVLTSGRFTR